MAQRQGKAIVRGLDIPDALFDIDGESSSVMAESYTIPSQVQVVRGPSVVEPDTDDHDPARQIGLHMHQRMDITSIRSLTVGHFEARRTDPSKHEWSAAHRLDEPKHLRGVLRKAPPDLRPRQKFKDLCVIVGPEPGMSSDKMLGLGDREKGGAIGRLNWPVEIPGQELGLNQRIGR